MASLPTLPPRPDNGHKGTFGTVCVLGGQAASPRVMIGGPAMSALAALRVGAGLAVLALPRPITASALAIAPEATALALPVDRDKNLSASVVAAVLDEHRKALSCIAIGPGLGVGEAQQQIVMRLIAQDGPPLVIDADALNCLAAVREFQTDMHAPAILTPHPGEYRRLADALRLSHDATDPTQREDAAREMAQRLGCVVVLKGNRTVISDGMNVAVNDTGNVALATAGTGDVLTGAIAGLVAQYAASTAPGDQPLSLFECAQLAVHIHGMAADRWAASHGNAGMLATDLLTYLPDTLHSMRERINDR